MNVVDIWQSREEIFPEGRSEKIMPLNAARGAQAAKGSDIHQPGFTVVIEPGIQLQYKEDWLGAPWVKPEAALLIHGGMESGEAWFGWVPRMGQEFRLLRPDLPGFGQSTVPADFEWSIGNYAGVLAKFLDKMGVASAHVVGAKTGGAVAMQFAGTYPQRTRTLILASGPFSPPTPGGNPPDELRFGTSASKEELEYFDRIKAATDPRTRAGLAKVLAGIDLDVVLPRITAPTLVITSDRGALQSLDTVLHYQPKIPNSRLLVLTSDAFHVAVANAGQCVTHALAFIREAQRHA
jgi:pimeloyl-ACP methyl ester carboxylesterase